MTTTTLIGDRRREAYARSRAHRRHPASRVRSSQTIAPPPTAFYAIGATVAALVLLGLVMVLSASSITSFHRGASPWRYFTKQLLWAFLGATALLVTYKVPYHLWRRLSRPFYVGSLLLMFAPFVPGIGRTVNGAHSWVAVGGFGLQPSELLKLAVLVFCADLLTRREAAMGDLGLTYWPCMVALALGSGMCVVQGDLGSAVVLAAIVMSVMFIGGIPFTPLAIGLGGFAALATMFVVSSPRRLARWTAFMDLEGNKDHYGYQVWQAIVSIANGGPTGVGVGAGTGKWGYVPLAHSDFIFAIIAEELGLVGVVAVIGGFALLAFFGVQVALSTTDRFGMLLAGGIAMWLVVQAIINIGGVTSVMPVTGLTLPFISFGGSSLLVSMAAAGVLLNVARRPR